MGNTWFTIKEVERLIGMPEKAIEYYFRRDGVLTSQAGGARGGVSIGYSRKDILVLSVISELHKSGVSNSVVWGEETIDTSGGVSIYKIARSGSTTVPPNRPLLWRFGGGSVADEIRITVGYYLEGGKK